MYCISLITINDFLADATSNMWFYWAAKVYRCLHNLCNIAKRSLMQNVLCYFSSDFLCCIDSANVIEIA